MGRYNLLREEWIKVIDLEGKNLKVSIEELLENANTYRSLAGENKTQDLAILRLILAIGHTVFSRFNYQGDVYDEVDLDDRYIPLTEVDDDDEYVENLEKTWYSLWVHKEFPPIIYDYLKMYEDRFYLFDDKYPFYQVRESQVSLDKIRQGKVSRMSAKSFNRLISESANKARLFSPKNAKSNNKEIISEDELARWLISLQSYVGLADKTTFGKEKYEKRVSKGWLYDLGAIYLEGKNLYETIILNLVLLHPEEDYIKNPQRPSWEQDPVDLIKDYLSYRNPDNLAELYTNWARAIYIDPESDMSKPFSLSLVKLPEINHQDNILEPMTLWSYSESGTNKETNTPKKHRQDISLWRNFQLLSLDDKKSETKKQKPIIVKWLEDIKDYLDDDNVPIVATSMEADGNATSWLPANEVYDRLDMGEFLLTDIQEDGWMGRINGIVDETKYVVDKIYGQFLINIKEIRKLKDYKFVNSHKEKLYMLIDEPFRDFIASIEKGDSKDDKEAQWRKTLKRLTLEEADQIIMQASDRDYKGIDKSESDNKEPMNIVIAYNIFTSRLFKKLG